MVGESSKQKSSMRFEQLKFIVYEVLPSIPVSKRGQTSVAYAAVLYACWMQAKGKAGTFDATFQQIADASGLNRRSVIRVMNELQAGKVIEITKRGCGNRGSALKFTWKLFQRVTACH